MKYSVELKIAMDAALAAGKYLGEQTSALIVDQSGRDIKLANDRMSEEIILDRLSKTGIPVLSEESGFKGINREDGLRWIVDPLDGSANYERGMKELSCVSIALWQDENPLIGIVNRYFTGEIYYGVVGEGAFLNEHKITVSDKRQIGQAVLATGFPVKRSYEDKSLQQFVKTVRAAKKIRMLGSAALMGTLVATGKIDAYIEEGIFLWDIAGAVAIAKAAGGFANVEMMGNNQCLCEIFNNEYLYFDYKKNDLG